MSSGKLFELSLSRRGTDPARKIRDMAQATDFFLEAGFAYEALAASEWKTMYRLAAYTPSAKLAERTARSAAHLRGWSFVKKTLVPEDWMDAWKKRYRISPLGRRFAVVPVWERKKDTGMRIPIVIDPQGAFGSGLHETTRLAVRMMEPLAGSFESFLDLGTGTGILCAAARHLGAREISGTDIDPGSVKTARLNLRINGIRGARILKDDLYRPALRGRFDLVAANMISKTLEETRKQILKFVPSGGLLLVTGISLANLPGFLKNFAGPPLRRLRILRGRSWGAVLYRRQNSEV